MPNEKPTPEDVVKWLRAREEYYRSTVEFYAQFFVNVGPPYPEYKNWHAAEADKCKAAADLIESQAAREEDRRESDRRVMLEPCDASEVHCTCVPVLRKALAERDRVRGMLAEALAELEPMATDRNIVEVQAALAAHEALEKKE